PCPAGRTQPIRTSWTLSATTPARSTAAEIARAPSAGAETSLKSPRKPPIGVRAAPTMTIASPALMALVSSGLLGGLSRAGGPRVNSIPHEPLERRSRALRASDRVARGRRTGTEQAEGRARPRGRGRRSWVACSAVSCRRGRLKTESAVEAIRRINPHVAVEPIAQRLDAANARAIVRRFDVALDGSDNFATRYALSDACYFERRPLVAAALGEFDGT